MNPRAFLRLAGVGLCLVLANCGKTTEQGSHTTGMPWAKDYTERHLRIATADGTRLSSSVFVPDAKKFSGKRPVVILGSSWALNEWEYDNQARQFAADGYVVLNYAPRGFGLSGGRVGVASAADIHDVTDLIDWLGANTSADMNRVAMAGVSYGAGLSLLAAAHDERIKTVVALSGWGDLIQALAPNESPRQVWISLLMGSGAIFGRLDPDLYKRVDDLFNHRNVEDLRAWARVRSPLNYVEHLNARQVPIFVGNSYQDNLFPPSQMREFYDKLTGPKMFYMDRGIHAMTAIPGLFGMPSEVWFDAHAWIDHWLLGKDTDIVRRPPVSFGTHRGREYYNEIPQPSSAESAVFKITALNKLAKKESASKESALSNMVIRLIGNIDSLATSGIPLLSDTSDALLGLPLMQDMNRINKTYAAIYLSQPVSTVTSLRGSPRVTIHLQPHQGPIQLNAYLYDVDHKNIGKLITHGTFSRYETSASATTLPLELLIAAYDVPAGHRIAVAIDTRDPLYVNPAIAAYPLEIDHSAHSETTVALPIVQI